MTNVSQLRTMFNNIKKQKEVKLKEKSTVSLKDDDRFITFSPGNTYEFRMIFWIPSDSTRTRPYINNVIHTYYNEDTKSFGLVTCPCSEHLDNVPLGYKNCPICQMLPDWYSEGKTSATSKELYNTFRRQQNFFMPVYIVSDTENPDNNGKVKIFRYGTTLNKYIHKKVFGMDLDTKEIATNSIGFDVFELQNGYNFIISVGSKVEKLSNGRTKTYNDYTGGLEFSRDKTDIGKTLDELEPELKLLRFEEDFFKPKDEKKLMEFYKKYILKDDVVNTPEISTKSESKSESTSSTTIMNEQTQPIVNKETHNSISTSVSNEMTVDTEDYDDSDIDAIINEVGGDI